jgi:hypothetical protein
MPEIRSDSKLLSGFSWSIIFKSEVIKYLTGYESVAQKVLLFVESTLNNFYMIAFHGT